MNKAELFYTELSPIVEKYSGDLKQVSKETGISKTSLWRWINKINSKLPNPYNVLSLLSLDSGEKSVEKIALYYGGEIAKFLEESFSHFFKENPNHSIVQDGLSDAIND